MSKAIGSLVLGVIIACMVGVGSRPSNAQSLSNSSNGGEENAPMGQLSVGKTPLRWTQPDASAESTTMAGLLNNVSAGLTNVYYFRNESTALSRNEEIAVTFHYAGLALPPVTLVLQLIEITADGGCRIAVSPDWFSGYLASLENQRGGM